MKTVSTLVASAALAASVVAPAFAEETKTIPLNVTVSTQATEGALAAGGLGTVGGAAFGAVVVAGFVAAGSNGSSSTTTTE
ncbi:hypothetical protein Dshi_3860 (plasmid) [Dinoroseobacter shibae DFL 12 = DSM 16493]|jgi:hypothetical protein|uniref:Secreted protein n=1 Tax=Dinoroseobacter shibae (strain DSM 16493 / NCIMB 14021 / DFL 12) TaxID=398580 RepID=A8LTM1_DINSH|nr:hypothetical protein [Dinoroseobacter shibae]ABV95588.1 hypothetical protein Dshi_3860 [Dinoroseobacter shibae DFL 12 = DSM 16493]URF48929.1 hypothetical protein M8008_19785 [Dinoroseobacter shibae]URF53241.1 hypothetical protein M8007_19810 [Dinoroseobacter shibae]